MDIAIMQRVNSGRGCSTSEPAACFASHRRTSLRCTALAKRWSPDQKRKSKGLQELNTLVKDRPQLRKPARKQVQDDDVLVLDLFAEDFLGSSNPNGEEGTASEQEVSIFDMDKGWNVDALSAQDIQALLAAAEQDANSNTEGSLGSGGNGELVYSTDGSVEYDFDAASEDDDDDDESPRAKFKKVAALQSLPQHMLSALVAAQSEAEEANKLLRPAALKAAAAARRVHRKLTIIGGTEAGKRLNSPQGLQTRPMMEKVRAAVFSMLQAQLGGISTFPAHARWLDLFAGTGAVGLEGLSRGCQQAHFVELDPWVADRCLKPNISTCNAGSSAVVHIQRAEDFLQRARASPRSTGGPFHFISVCPPYLLVSYEELYDLLCGSPLLTPETYIIVEYPKQLAHLIRDEIKPLKKVKDRRYGRTYLAIYGPADAVDADFLL